METREIISASAGMIEYKATFDSGSTGIFSCDTDDWKVYEIKRQLVDQGADEALVNDLYQRGYSKGYEEAEYDVSWDA